MSLTNPPPPLFVPMIRGQKRTDENTYFNFAFNFSEQRATLKTLVSFPYLTHEGEKSLFNKSLML